MPVPLHVGAPGKPLLRVSVSWVCVCELSALCCDIVWSSVLVRVLSGAFVLAIMSVYLSGLSGSLGGEVLDLSAPRSPKAALQRCGAAHGPLHPAVFFSKLCCLCFAFLSDLPFVSFLKGLLLWDDLLGSVSP